MDYQRIIKAAKRRLRHYPLFYPRKNEDAIRWGIIGLGNMAEVFASALDDDRDSKIVAVASRSIGKATAFASRHGHARAYGSYDEMLNDSSLQLDVVYIATPAKYHAIQIKQCLEARKSVLCEKPITSSSEELKPLIKCAKENNLFLMEGMWMKCLPTFKKAKEWLQQGKIGQLELIKVDFYKRELINPNRTVFNASEGGGIMHDYGVYALAFIDTFLNGTPEVLHGEARKSAFAIDADWQISAQKNGIKAFVNLSSNFKGLSKAALIGSKGVIEWDAQFNRSNRIVLYDEYGKQQEEFSKNYQSEGLEYEIEEVRRCIKNGRYQSDLVPLQSTLNTISMMDTLTVNN